MWNKINNMIIKKKLQDLVLSPLMIPKEKVTLDGKGGIRVAENLLKYNFFEECESNKNHC